MIKLLTLLTEEVLQVLDACLKLSDDGLQVLMMAEEWETCGISEVGCSKGGRHPRGFSRVSAKGEGGGMDFLTLDLTRDPCPRVRV